MGEFMTTETANFNIGHRANRRAAARLLAGSVSAAALILGFQATAFAQDKPAASGDTGVQEIVVTAQKREQKLQDVPVAVTALVQATLQANCVTNVMDSNVLAPGLIGRTNDCRNMSPS